MAHIAEWVALAFSVSYGPFLLAAPWIVRWPYCGGSAAATPTPRMTGWTVAGKQDGDDAGHRGHRRHDRPGAAAPADPGAAAGVQERLEPAFHTLPVRDGRGYCAVFSLPLGVTAEMIADARAVLARNVHRDEVEVWPSDAAKAGTGPAGTVAVWIADPGVLGKPAPEYPLLHEGTADVFEGVPGGVTPRGERTDVPVVGNNFVAGGQLGQGKSNACRVVMLGSALDPLAELDVFVFANNGDFDAYAPRLAVYVKGVEDEQIAAAVARLHELYAEVARREARLAELGAKKLTRALAQAHPDLRPIVALFSECHELFGHPEYGAVAAELATKTVKRARKTAITLGFDTQSSRKEAIPPKLVELVSVNVCFYVKTWRSNDGFLGDGSFAAGIRATELRPGRDRGTALITGVSDAQFELLRWYFVEVDDDTGYRRGGRGDRPRGRPGRAGHAGRGRPSGARDRGPGPARGPGRGPRRRAGQAPRRRRTAAEARPGVDAVQEPDRRAAPQAAHRRGRPRRELQQHALARPGRPAPRHRGPHDH